MRRPIIHIGLAGLIALAPIARTDGATAPKLIVVLVVDQMRADYVDKFQKDWKAGLRRLLDRGARFSRAAYPYLNTVTCPGHATISTGSLPMTHGLVLNEWWDRALGQRVTCTEDPAFPTIGYGGPVAGGHSYKWLMVSTFADEMRAQLGEEPRIATLSIKPRSAIMLAGRRATSVTWFDRGTWATSTAYAQAPAPFVQEFIDANPVTADFGKAWTRVLPDSAYLYKTSPNGLALPGEWTTAWPHPLRGKSDKPDAAFFEVWEESPFSDRHLSKMAVHTIDRLKLGQRQASDFLGVSFSALDGLGHDFGPNSQEVQDLLAQLDVTIGELLSHLDRVVGADRYVVALSADHGVAPVPEQMTRLGLDAGRIEASDLTTRLERALTPHLGVGPHVAHVVYTDVYFAPGVYERLKTNEAAMKAALDAVAATNGVSRVFRSEELQMRTETHDPAARAAALSYYPGRSGDLIIVPRPYWLTSRTAWIGPANSATHGTLYAYDTRVPLILMGAPFKGGEYFQAATPADIAPTLAYLSGITLPHPDGRVLSEALQQQDVPDRASRIDP